MAALFRGLLTKYTIQGAIVNRIAWKEFPTYPVLAPPLSLQMAFHEVASSVWAKVQRNQTQAQTLAALRDTFLLRLIFGPPRLPEAQHLIEEATA